jgi:drug/metabolite transporter (DMT)-like permease
MKSRPERNLLAFAALAVAGGGWGLGFPMGKLALAETSASSMVLLRFAIAAVIALPFVLRNARTRAVLRSWPVIGSGALYGVGFVLQFEGLARANVAIAALLVGILPAMVAVAARLMGDHISRMSWAGVIAATAGAALLTGKPEGAATPAGILITLLSMGVFCVWFFLLKKAPPPPDPVAIPAAMVVVAAVAIAPIALVMHGIPRLDLSPVAWGGIVGQALLSTVIATAAWQYGSVRVASAAAGVFINIEPMLGAILGVVIFGDHAGWPLALGGTMVLAGSLVVVLGEKPTPSIPA